MSAVTTAAAWRPDGTSIAYGKLTLIPVRRGTIRRRLSAAVPTANELSSIDLAYLCAEISHAREVMVEWMSNLGCLVRIGARRFN